MKSRRLLFLSVVAALGVAACAGSDDGAASSAAGPVVTDARVPIAELVSDADPVGTETAPVGTEPEAEPVVTEAEPEPTAYDFAGVDLVVQAFVDDRGLNGAGLVIVDADDGVILERYWGEFGPERSSLIA